MALYLSITPPQVNYLLFCNFIIRQQIQQIFFVPPAAATATQIPQLRGEHNETVE